MAALYDDWMALMSTFASVVLALLAAYFLPSLPMAKALLEIAAIICFLIASYRVWLKERKARLKDQEIWQAKLDELRSQLESEIAKLKKELETEKANLLSQSQAEKAKDDAPEIKGEIYEILFNQTLGGYVTVRASIINVRPLATRVKSFKLKMKVKGKSYESQNFHTRGLNRAKHHRAPNTAIKNLADCFNLPEGLKHNLAEEGYLRFRVEGLIPTQEITQDERWTGSFTEDMFFDLDDVEDVLLIVIDHLTEYEIGSSGVEPQWAEITDA